MAEKQDEFRRSDFINEFITVRQNTSENISITLITEINLECNQKLKKHGIRTLAHLVNHRSNFIYYGNIRSFFRIV